jgi:hypothetical protein
MKFGMRSTALLTSFYLRFWRYTRAKLREGMRSRKIKNWVLELDNDDDLVSGKYPKLSLEPLDCRENDLFCSFTIERDNQFRPYYGIHYSHPIEARSQGEKATQSISAYKSLEADLRDDGFRPSRPWWPVLKYMRIRLREKTSILQLARNDQLQKAAAETFLDMFDKYRSLIEELNDGFRSHRIS